MIALQIILTYAVAILLAQNWLSPYFDVKNVMTMEYLQSLA